MSTLFIGTNAIGHDSAVFLVIPDTKEVVALATERVTRIKHDKLFFFPALEKALANRHIDPHTITTLYLGHTFTSRAQDAFFAHEYECAVAERTHFGVHFTKDLADARKTHNERSTLQKIRELARTSSGRYLLKQKLLTTTGISPKVPIDTIITNHLTHIFPNATITIEYFDHQECHAMSSYFTSPYEEALLVSYDGWGDDLFSRAFVARAGTITPVASSPCPTIRVSATEYPHTILGSPGGMYAYITHLLGFKPVSEEGKVEALAASSPKHEALYERLRAVFSLDTTSHTLHCNVALAERTLSVDAVRPLIAASPREHIAAAVQAFLDDCTKEYISHLLTVTEQTHLCLSGGTAANVIMNLMIFEHLTPHVHITPAMADDGTAQGAALLTLLKHGYTYTDLAWLKGETMPYLGTSYTKDQVRAAAEPFHTKIALKDLGDTWPEEAAHLLAAGKIGAIFHGRMEWGPRALGNRSIIADPRPKEFREKINKTIKRRPLFQPFCPSILAEEAPRLFEHYYLNKHMTCAFRMRREFWDALPSAIHIDGTARAQFVTNETNPAYYRLLKKVKELTGFGVSINTSFNKHGRTIVETPTDAIQDFLDTDMDYVIIEGLLITRT
jgi:carbamoyltransferase